MIFVTAIHGDEPAPVFALAKNKIDQFIAHPRALSSQVRFIDSDLNASFGDRNNNFESKLARQILKKISPDQTIIDLHSTSSPGPPFAIVVDLKMIKLAQTTGLKHVVYMKFNIKKGCSLIDKRSGISIETGPKKSYTSYQNTLKIIRHLEKPRPQPVKIYTVYALIKKPGHYINFKKHHQGFYPLFTGETSYNFYGLKSRLDHDLMLKFNQNL